MGIQRDAHGQININGNGDLHALPAVPPVSSDMHDAQAAGDGRAKSNGQAEAAANGGGQDSSDSHDEGTGERSGLRQRLKAVVRSATHTT